MFKSMRINADLRINFSFITKGIGLYHLLLMEKTDVLAVTLSDHSLRPRSEKSLRGHTEVRKGSEKNFVNLALFYFKKRIGVGRRRRVRQMAGALWSLSVTCLSMGVPPVMFSLKAPITQSWEMHTSDPQIYPFSNFSRLPSVLSYKHTGQNFRVNPRFYPRLSACSTEWNDRTSPI